MIDKILKDMSQSELAALVNVEDMNNDEFLFSTVEELRSFAFDKADNSSVMVRDWDGIGSVGGPITHIDPLTADKVRYRKRQRFTFMSTPAKVAIEDALSKSLGAGDEYDQFNQCSLSFQTERLIITRLCLDKNFSLTEAVAFAESIRKPLTDELSNIHDCGEERGRDAARAEFEAVGSISHQA